MRESPSGDSDLLVTRASDDVDLAEVFRVRRTAGWIDDVVEGELWVCSKGGRHVGSLQIREVQPGADWLDAVVVDGDLRGAGIGARMVRHVLATRENDCWLECERVRRDFYRRLGFELILRAEVPSWVRQIAGSRIDRPQYFMHLGRGGM